MGGLPVCTVGRLVTDLLDVREDGSAVARVCQDAVTTGLIDAAGLEPVVAPYVSTYGATSPAAFVADLIDRAGERNSPRR